MVYRPNVLSEPHIPDYLWFWLGENEIIEKLNM